MSSVGMLPVTQYLHTLLGKRFGGDDLVAVFSARVDESGTDGRSPYTVVGGAVATADNWEKIEAAWGRLLVRSKVSSYHGKEFKDGKGVFLAGANSREIDSLNHKKE